MGPHHGAILGPDGPPGCPGPPGEVKGGLEVGEAKPSKGLFWGFMGVGGMAGPLVPISRGYILQLGSLRTAVIPPHGVRG